MGIINDLYSGQIFPAEEIVPRDPEYRALEQKVKEAKDYLFSRLPLEDGARLDHMYELIMSESSLYAYYHFAYGFKLGALLMQEISTESNGPGP